MKIKILRQFLTKNVSETFEALKDIKIYQKEKEVKDKFLTDITKFERNIFSLKFLILFQNNIRINLNYFDFGSSIINFHTV